MSLNAIELLPFAAPLLIESFPMVQRAQGGV
jgi:hypothetical protein